MFGRLIFSGALLFAAASCALHTRPTLATQEMAEFWAEPVDLERRDLFHGPGGAENAPRPDDKFEFLDIKTSGSNPGYDVRDSRGMKWSVKLGVESRVEVVLSRLVWALGYHQPAVYYLPQWTLRENGRDTIIERGRFRLEAPGEKKLGDWSWRDNQFLETQPFAGLVVLMVMLNNWDMKTAQNVLYEVEQADDEPRRRYVVRDLGAALGKTVWLNFGSKDDPEGFESEPFIERVQGNRVYFAYSDSWLEPQLLTGITPADVRWTSELLSRLSDQQWQDAFRAGGFSRAEADRYIMRIKQKIAQGRRLR